MTKTEFLSALRGQIAGRIPIKEVESQVDYYSSYIDGKVASGLSEADVIEELGDPRLIAKMVIESTDRIAEAAGYDGGYKSSTDTYDDSDGINSGIFGNGKGTGSSYQGSYSTGSGYTHQSASSAGRSQQSAQQQGGNNNGSPSAEKTGCTIAAIVIILVIALILAILYFVFRVTFSIFGWLLPAIAVVVIIGVIISVASRNK